MKFQNGLLFLVLTAILPSGQVTIPESLGYGQPKNSQSIASQSDSPSGKLLLEQLLASTSISRRQDILARNAQLISPELIEALLKRANPVRVQKDFEPVASLNRLVLGLAQRIGYSKGRARAIHNLGVIHRKTRQFELATRYHQESAAIYRAIHDTEGLSQTARSVALIHYEQENYPETLKYYLEDLALAKETKQPYPLARAYYNLGISHERLEQASQAIKMYELCISVSQSIVNPLPENDIPGLIADAQTHIGNCYYTLLEFNQSINAIQKAISLYHQLGRGGEEAATTSFLGLVYNEAGLYDQAITYSRKTLTMWEMLKVDTPHLIPYFSIALASSAQRDPTTAIKTIEEVKARVERQYKNNARQPAALQTLWSMYRAEGIIRRAAGQPEQARAAFDKAIGIIEQENAQIPITPETGPTSLRYQYSPYGLMTALLINQGAIEEALDYAERTKSRFLYDALSNPTGRANQFVSPANIQERQHLVDQILALEIEISREQYGAQPDSQKLAALQSTDQQAKVALAAVQTRIEAELDAIAARRPQQSKLTRQGLLALLPNEQTALLQFAMSEEQAFLFVVTKPGGVLELQAYPLKMRTHIIRAGVERFRNLITHRDQSKELDQVAREWHDKLLGSARSQLQNVRSFIIVPDGPLWDMPFQALKTPDDRFLIESRAITYAPSFNVLRLMSQPIMHSPPDYKLLALGNPSLSTRKKIVPPGGLMDDLLLPLPEAEKQVNLIRKYYGQQKSTVLIGNLATEARFKALAPNYRILHLAAHGLYNDLDPMRSSIVLSQLGKSTDEDGFLEAREIIRLKLNAELVILSACETGRGEIRDGEGIIGLPYALFIAGCPTTIVSQWKVSAQSTADLMVSLHTHLNQKEVSKAEALRRAALSLIHGPKADFRHPFYWAGFIVFGKAD